MLRTFITVQAITWAFLGFSFALRAEAQAAAPKVTATQPRSGDLSVASDLREVVVTFDQDMDTTGYSFVGGGPSFPTVTGKPSWRNARECVLPVQVEAGHAYTLGINIATHGSFKSSTGLSATPVVLTFTVRGAGNAPQAPAPTAATQAESVRQLREAIERRYSYRDVHKVDWPAAWKLFEPRLLAAKTSREFAVVAGEMLAATQDAHIWLTEGGEVVPAFRRVATPNANIKRLPALLTGWSQKDPMVAVGRASKDTGYIAIHSWDRKQAPQLLEAAYAALEELKGTSALIVDVRFNSGGDERLAREFAGCFIRERKLYAKHVVLDSASTSGFSAPMERWLEPTPNRPAYAGKVAVLVGPVNMSSAEAFLLMMKQVPGCKLVGARSFGASGNPQPHALANGVTVMLPSWKAMLPDGTEFETNGIAPDVAVTTKPEDFAQDDPVLMKALLLLESGP
jgi:carboxyl-terminal processing protease